MSDKMAVHFSSATEIMGDAAGLLRHARSGILGFRWMSVRCPKNAKCLGFFTPEMDGLAQEWAPFTCWMNPPYGRTIGLWMRKAYESAQRGATVVCLVPARTDTAWWHDYAIKGEVRFIRGRLKFGGSPNSAPFPNAVVVFRPPLTEPLDAYDATDLLYAQSIGAE